MYTLLLLWPLVGLFTFFLLCYLEGPCNHTTIEDLLAGVFFSPIILPLALWSEWRIIKKHLDYWTSKLAYKIGKLNPTWKKENV